MEAGEAEETQSTAETGSSVIMHNYSNKLDHIGFCITFSNILRLAFCFVFLQR